MSEVEIELWVRLLGNIRCEAKLMPALINFERIFNNELRVRTRRFESALRLRYVPSFGDA